MKPIYFSQMVSLALISAAANAAYINTTSNPFNITQHFNITGSRHNATGKHNMTTLHHTRTSTIYSTTTLTHLGTSTFHGSPSTVSSDPYTGTSVTHAFYNNYWNGDATAGANFDHPGPTVTLAPGAQQYVKLDLKFKGRVQRGTQLPATWAEFQVQATDGQAWGDISLEQGYDGPATIASPDGTGVVGGFTHDAFEDAPAAAFKNKPDGSKALASTVGNWAGGPNQATIAHLNQVVGQKSAYITGGDGTEMTISKTPCLVVKFY